MATHMMWFRKDLRLEDNTALNYALTSLDKKDQLLCVFHLDEQQFRIGCHAHDYFFSTLNNFQKSAKEKGVFIHFLSGDLFSAFDNLKQQFPDWSDIYFNLDNRGYGLKRDLTTLHFLESKEIRVTTFEENHLHQATEITKPDGSSYKKFTPYYKRWLSLSKPMFQPDFNIPNIKQIKQDSEFFKEGDKLFKKLLDLRQTDFSLEVGEERATERLNDFVLNQLDSYEQERDFPGIDGTSRLSSHLSTGSISIRKVFHACQAMPSSNGKDTFIKELAWRDFYHMIYHYHPDQYKKELIEKYRQLPWQTNEELFNQWKNGQTGYPIIDAAMRQLQQTGWMHNRLRMLVASFLTKDLLIDWRLGERYFAEQLIDYDAASNIGGWQWAASTGTDAVPYFRIFNPTTQGKKFDKDGLFIKTYLPELASLPAKFIHEPSTMSSKEQEEFQFQVGIDYPKPIVDHKLARAFALEWFK